MNPNTASAVQSPVTPAAAGASPVTNAFNPIAWVMLVPILNWQYSWEGSTVVSWAAPPNTHAAGSCKPCREDEG